MHLYLLEVVDIKQSNGKVLVACGISCSVCNAFICLSKLFKSYALFERTSAHISSNTHFKHDLSHLLLNKK